jgi:hypothetical protein
LAHRVSLVKKKKKKKKENIFPSVTITLTRHFFRNRWSQHLHYDMEIRTLTVSGSYAYARKHKWEYANFGAIAFGLEIIPVFNIFFMWTNIVGAALWVAEEYEADHQAKAASGSGEQRREENYPVAQAPSTSSERTPLLSNNDNEV